MSDSVINYYYAWLKYYAAKIPSDTVLLVTAIIYGIAFICFFAYKFASYDSDILFASRSVIRYLSSSESKLMGSLNYYMRSFPIDVYRRWEKFYTTKVGKPSDYITTDLAYTHGVLESGFITTMKILVVFLTAINLAFSLVKEDIPREMALFMPILTLTFGLSITHLVELIFTFIKRRAYAAFKEFIDKIDIYAKDFIPTKNVLEIKDDDISKELKESIEKVLEKEPLEVYASDNKSC